MMRPGRGREKPIERQAGSEDLSRLRRVPGEEGGGLSAHMRHLVAGASRTAAEAASAAPGQV